MCVLYSRHFLARIQLAQLPGAESVSSLLELAPRGHMTTRPPVYLGTAPIVLCMCQQPPPRPGTVHRIFLPFPLEKLRSIIRNGGKFRWENGMGSNPEDLLNKICSIKICSIFFFINSSFHIPERVSAAMRYGYLRFKTVNKYLSKNLVYFAEEKKIRRKYNYLQYHSPPPPLPTSHPGQYDTLKQCLFNVFYAGPTLN